MAVTFTVTPSTQYLEDNITIRITKGSLPSGAYVSILAKQPNGLWFDVGAEPISGTSKTFKILHQFEEYGTLDYFYEQWPSQSSIQFEFDILDRNYESISTSVVSKTLNIKPQPPIFNATPVYQDVKTQSLLLTNDNKMIVNGLSTIRISNLVGTVYKMGTLKTIKINDVPTNYDYNTIINGDGYVDVPLDDVQLNKKLSITLIDSRGWSVTETIADISKFKYIWQKPKTNKFEVEHDEINETTLLTANGTYSEGYQLGTTTLGINYSYKENVEGSTEVIGTTTLNINKTQTDEYGDFVEILDEYNTPTYQLDENDLQYYSKQIFENNINNLFLSAISYNDKYTQEYLQVDYDSENERYYCKSGNYNGSWKQFWKDTLELIYDKIIENGGNYQWEIQGSNYETSVPIQGDTQNGFSIDKTFNVFLNISEAVGSDTDYKLYASSQTLLSTALPAIDIYKSNVAIHGIYDENLGGTQLNGDIYINGNLLPNIKRVVIETTTGSSTGSWSQVASLNFSKVFNIVGCFVSGTNEFYPVPRSYNNQEVTFYAKKSDQAIYEMHNYTFASNKSLLLIVDYI